MRIRIKPAFFASFFTMTFLVMCCASLSPSDQEDSKHAQGYQLDVPSDWKIKNSQAGDRAYELPSGSAVTVSSSCDGNKGGASLDLLTKHLLFGARNVEIEKSEKLNIDEVHGLHSSVRATFDGKPLFLQLFVLPKGGCVFDFSLISKRRVPPSESKEFVAFLKTFHYEARP